MVNFEKVETESGTVTVMEVDSEKVRVGSGTFTDAEAAYSALQKNKDTSSKQKYRSRPQTVAELLYFNFLPERVSKMRSFAKKPRPPTMICSCEFQKTG